MSRDVYVENLLMNKTILKEYNVWGKERKVEERIINWLKRKKFEERRVISGL